MLTPGDIDLNNRPVVTNPDGSISTLRSMSFNQDGREVLIPTIRRGLDRPMTNDEAIAHYQQTGEHLGHFDTPDNATAYSQQLHQQQAKMYAGPKPPVTNTTDYDTLINEIDLRPAPIRGHE